MPQLSNQEPRAALASPPAAALFDFLATSTPAPAEWFYPYVRQVRLPKGALVCGPGDRCAAFPLVLSGTVRVYVEDDDGHSATLYKLGPGDGCALTASCMFGEQDFPATAMTETAVEALLVPASVVLQWFGQHDGWRTYIAGLLVRRLVDTARYAEAAAFKPLPSRLAAYLMDAAREADTVHATHEQMAQELGCSREAVSRALKQFERDGSLRLSRGAVHLLDQKYMLAQARG